MAMTIYSGGDRARQAKAQTAKYTFDAEQAIRGQAGVSVASSGHTATFGTDTDPANNTALVTPATVNGTEVTFTVTAAEITAIATWYLDVVIALTGSAETLTPRVEIEVPH